MDRNRDKATYLPPIYLFIYLSIAGWILIIYSVMGMNNILHREIEEKKKKKKRGKRRRKEEKKEEKRKKREKKKRLFVYLSVYLSMHELIARDDGEEKKIKGK